MFEKYTLVVVDMQPFYTTDTATIANVAREVKLARQRNNSIIFLTVPYLSPLQSAPFKPTYPEILEEVREYDTNNWYKAEKIFNDGSRNIFNACDWMHFPRNCFRVCGVNIDLCVLHTVMGLLRDPFVEAVAVVKDACQTTSPEANGVIEWQGFPSGPRLRLVDAEHGDNM